MRYLVLAAVSGLALAAAGCTPRNLVPRTALDCPDRVGELTRTAVAADRKSCSYQTASAEVTLELVPVTGDAETTLQGVEAQLKGSQPAAGAPATAGAATTPGATAAKADSASAHAAEAASKEAVEDAKSAPSGKVDINVGSGKIHVEGDEGDKGEAHIDLPGLHVDANNGHADVNVAGVHVNASDEGADVHMMRDMRLRGEAFSRERRGIEAIFTSTRPNGDGTDFVGYSAAGPKTGPLAVALVRGRSDIDRHGRLYRDITRLVRRNGDLTAPE
jgi:hypothetical protein